MTSVASRLYSEFVRPKQGVRVPTFPERRRTGLMGQSFPLSMEVETEAHLVLTRDPVFPLWADQAINVSYSASWTWSQPNDGGLVEYDMNTFDDPRLYALTGASDGNSTLVIPGVTGGTPPVGGVPFLATFPEIDSEPYLWVPKGSYVYCTSAVGTRLSAGALDVTVQVEQRYGADYPGFTRKLATTRVPDGRPSVTWFDNGIIGASADADGGVWVRPKVCTWQSIAGSTQWTGTRQASFTINVFGNFNVTQVTGDGTATDKFNVVGTATKLPLFLPLLNLNSSRSSVTAAGALITRNVKTVGSALTVENMTAVMNQEGSMNCVRFVDGAFTPFKPPRVSDYGIFTSVDKLTARLANGLHTFVRPGVEFSRFSDNTWELRGVTTLNSLDTFPVARYYPGMEVNCVRFADRNNATRTELLLSYSYSVEFITDDVLLRPSYASGFIHDVEAAVKRLESIPVFSLKAHSPEMLLDRRPVDRTMAQIKRQVAAPAAMRRPRAPPRRKPQRGQPQPQPKKPAPKAAPKKKGGLTMYLESKRRPL